VNTNYFTFFLFTLGSLRTEHWYYDRCVHKQFFLCFALTSSFVFTHARTWQPAVVEECKQFLWTPWDGSRKQGVRRAVV